MFSVRRANIDDLQLIVDFQIKMAVQRAYINFMFVTISKHLATFYNNTACPEGTHHTTT